MFVGRTFAAALIIAALAAASMPASGSVIDAAQMSAIIQSTATDTDVFALIAFFGFAPEQTLEYSSTAATSPPSGALTGVYLGIPVNVVYSWQSGAIWNDTGTYGSLAWNGSGQATFSDTSSTTFELDFTDSLTVGANSATVDYQIPGTVLADGTVMFGDPSDTEVGSGTVTGISVNPCYSYASFFDRTLTDIVPHLPGKTCQELVPPNAIDRYVPSAIGSFTALSGTIETVPEPASWLMFGSGMVGIFCYRARRFRRAK